MSLTSSTPPGISGTLTTHSPNRIFSIDVIKGIALIGILVTSIWEFGGFISNQQLFYRHGTHSGGNFRLWAIVSILFEGKMLSLFALVFGAGIILFLQKKDHPSTASTADLYIRRQIWLIFFGVVCAFVFLWSSDILYPLGVMGILMYVFWRLAPKRLLIAAIICTLIFCGKQYWNFADDRKAYNKYQAVLKVEEQFKKDSTARAKTDSIAKVKDSLGLNIPPKLDTATGSSSSKMVKDSLDKKGDTLTRWQVMDKENWENIAKRVKYDSSATEAENKSMRASYPKVWNYLMQRSQNKESIWVYRIGIWDFGSMMFLGMALLGMGFFQHRFSNSKYTLIAILSLVIGYFLAWYRIHYGDKAIVDYAKYIENSAVPQNFFLPIEKFVLVLGYASVIMLVLRSNFFNWLSQALAAVGRMWLTNYILQVVICTFFFYGYGFGAFGRLSQWQLYFVVVEISLVLSVFSIFWLRYYRWGPFEWMWKCFIYRKWLPNKIQQTETTSISPAS